MKDITNTIKEYQTTNHTIQLRNHIIMSYIEYIKTIATIIKKTYYSIECDDMINDGVVGLINAIESFKPDRNTRFSTFSSYKIKGNILDEIRRRDWIKRGVRDFERKYIEINETLQQEMQTTFVPEKLIREKMGFTSKKWNKVVLNTHYFSMFSTDNTIHLKNTDRIIDDKSSQPHKIMEEKELCDVLKGAMKQLSIKKQRIIKMYFWKGLTQNQISKKLGVTEAAISHAISTSMRIMRKHLEKIGYEIFE